MHWQYDIPQIANEGRTAKPSPKAMPCKPVVAKWRTTVGNAVKEVDVTIEWATVDAVWFINPVKTSRKYGQWMNTRRPALGVHSPIRFENPRQKIEFVTYDGQTVDEADDEESPVGLTILRYNEALQKLVGARTKAEPWMHIGFVGTDMSDDDYWAIWIWDTRKVLEEGKCLHESREQARNFAPYAHDNLLRLPGSSKFAKLFSIILTRKRQFK